MPPLTEREVVGAQAAHPYFNYISTEDAPNLSCPMDAAFAATLQVSAVAD
ncbi:MAG: hypothetical protein ACYDC6_11630 [Acidobacteriaceae bacterium]